MKIKSRYKYIATGYASGALAVELLQLWAGVLEWPFREIGAILWPILLVVSFIWS